MGKGLARVKPLPI